MSLISVPFISARTADNCFRQVAIIHVEKRDYMVEPITLKTVRPFIMDDIDLDDELEAAGLTIDDKQAVGKLLKTKIQDLIGRIDEEWDIKHAETPKEERPEKMLPLIRLRVQYTRHEMGNLVRFGQDFVGKVANPKDLLQFSKKKTTTKKKGGLAGYHSSPPCYVLIAPSSHAQTRAKRAKTLSSRRKTWCPLSGWSASRCRT